MQTFNFKVHSAHKTPMAIKIELNGQEVEAVVTGLVVEMVNEDKTITQTRRFIPTDWDAANKLYAEGAAIITTDDVDPDAPAPKDDKPAPTPAPASDQPAAATAA